MSDRKPAVAVSNKKAPCKSAAALSNKKLPRKSAAASNGDDSDEESDEEVTKKKKMTTKSRQHDTKKKPPTKAAAATVEAIPIEEKVANLPVLPRIPNLAKERLILLNRRQRDEGREGTHKETLDSADEPLLYIIIRRNYFNMSPK